VRRFCVVQSCEIEQRLTDLPIEYLAPEQPRDHKNGPGVRMVGVADGSDGIVSRWCSIRLRLCFLTVFHSGNQYLNSKIVERGQFSYRTHRVTEI